MQFTPNDSARSHGTDRREFPGDQRIGKIVFRGRDVLPGLDAGRLRGFERRPRSATHPDVVDGSQSHEHTGTIIGLRS